MDKLRVLMFIVAAAAGTYCAAVSLLEWALP